MAKRTKSVRRGVRRNVIRAIVYIKATFNNTLVTITDMNGDTICRDSAGTVGFKGSRKSTPFACKGRRRSAPARRCVTECVK